MNRKTLIKLTFYALATLFLLFGIFKIILFLSFLFDKQGFTAILPGSTGSGQLLDSSLALIASYLFYKKNKLGLILAGILVLSFVLLFYL